MLLVVAVLFLSSCLWLAQRYFARNNNFKRYGFDPGCFGWKSKAAQQNYVRNAHIILREIYEDAKHSGSNYKLQTDDNEVIIIAPKFLPELRNLTLKQLSHPEFLINKYMGYYNGIAEGVKTQQHVEICRNQLTHSLPDLVPGLKEELDFSIQEMIETQNSVYSTCTAWDLMFACVLHLSSRAFVGPDVCRDPVWLAAMGGYPLHVVPMAYALRPYPHFVRSILKYIHPAARQIRKDVSLAREVLYPLILKMTKTKGSSTDCLQFLLDTQKGQINPEQVVQQIFVLIGGACVTTIMAAMHSLYDLLSQPQDLHMLRTEALEALAATNGQWTDQTLKQLSKLDSFLKESLRLNAPAASNFNERVIAPGGIKLSNGDHLPYGAFLETPAEAPSLDLDNYPDPKTFDSLRFYNLARQKQDSKGSGEANSNYDFVTIESQANLAFGLGRHTCPGRWFAAAMMKLIFATLLVEYDVQYADESLRSKGMEGRPKNSYSRGTILPDRSVLVEIKRRANGMPEKSNR